jgi:hypothetical protein
MSEHDLKDVRRAEQARQLLDNPLHDEAWNALRERLLSLMETARTDEAVLKAKLALNLLTDLKAHWLRVVNDGVVAAGSLQLEEAKKRWYQRFAA